MREKNSMHFFFCSVYFSLFLHFKWLQWRRAYLFVRFVFVWFGLYKKVKQQIVEWFWMFANARFSPTNSHCVVYFKIILSNCLHIISAFEFMTNNWVYIWMLSRSNTKKTGQNKKKETKEMTAEKNRIYSMWNLQNAKNLIPLGSFDCECFSVNMLFLVLFFFFLCCWFVLPIIHLKPIRFLCVTANCLVFWFVFFFFSLSFVLLLFQINCDGKLLVSRIFLFVFFFLVAICNWFVH